MIGSFIIYGTEKRLFFTLNSVFYKFIMLIVSCNEQVRKLASLLRKYSTVVHQQPPKPTLDRNQEVAK